MLALHHHDGKTDRAFQRRKEHRLLQMQVRAQQIERAQQLDLVAAAIHGALNAEVDIPMLLLQQLTGALCRHHVVLADSK